MTRDPNHPNQHRTRPTLRTWLLAILLGLATTLPARADGGSQMPATVPGAYKQECASCHLAYPPGMLPAASWQRLMGRLDRHFGTDASLDAATVQQLGTWLQAHAGTSRRVREAPPQDRITLSPWFVRKHRSVASTVWALPSVQSAANCAACHTGAERGLYDDDNLKSPEGMDARSRRAWND